MDPTQLAKVPLFQRLPIIELEKLAAQMSEISLVEDTFLFREGDRGDYFYVISQGELEVIKALETEDERLIAVRTDGDFIGELSLINPLGTRMAAVKARTDARLWQLSRKDFETVLEENALLANQIVRELSQRLTNAHEKTIVDLQRKNLELTIAYRDLQDAQEQIIEKERLERELQLAHQIQTSILPEVIPDLAEIEIGVFLEPARAVGGDFYDVFQLEEGKFSILIGDVTDKGVPSALVMAQTHALIYSAAVAGMSPIEVFEQVNTQMIRLNQSGLFVTAIYGILDLIEGKFTYARAGHEVPLLLKPNGEVVLIPKGTGQPLGLFDEAVFDLQEIKFTPGERLLLYTDGAVDMHNESKVQFGMDGLQQVFIQSSGHGAQDACCQIYDALVEFQGGSDQDDDITLVMIHVKS